MSETLTNQEIYDRIQNLAEAAGNTAIRVKALATGISAMCEDQSDDSETIDSLSLLAKELAQQIDEKNQAIVPLIFQLRKQDPNIKPQ